MADSSIRQPFGSKLTAGDDWSWKVSLQNYPPSQFTLKYFFRGPASGASLNLTATEDPSETEFIVAASGAQTSPLPAGVYGWQMCIYNTLGAGGWEADRAYELGALVYDGTNIQKCTTPGTSGSSAPSWSSELDGNTNDGSVVWTNQGTGVRKELDRGQLEIIADLSSLAAPYDARSWVKKSLDAVRAVLQGRAGRVEQQYMIAGRELQLMKPAELMKWEGHLAARYNRELVESGQLSPSYNQVRGAFGDPTDPILERLWKNYPGNSQ